MNNGVGSQSMKLEHLSLGGWSVGLTLRIGALAGIGGMKGKAIGMPKVEVLFIPIRLVLYM